MTKVAFQSQTDCLWENACLVCSSLPPVVCGRTHVLFVRLYLQLFVGGSMSCLFVFTSSCLWEEACLVCSSLPPVVCGRKHVLLVLFVFVYVLWCLAHFVLCFCFSSSYVPYVAGFSGLSLSIATSIFSNVYSTTKMEVRSTHAVIILLSTICVY
jgi:hypothetical protein